MTPNGSAAPVRAPFNRGRVLLGALIAVAGHAVVLAAAVIAGRVVKPSAGGGFEDLGAIVVVFFLGEAIFTLACVIAGAVLIRKDRRELGLGVALGWLLGVVSYVILAVAPQI